MNSVVKKEIYTVSVLGQDEGSNIPLCLQKFQRAKPKGIPEGGEVYLTVFTESITNMDSISF